MDAALQIFYIRIESLIRQVREYVKEKKKGFRNRNRIQLRCSTPISDSIKQKDMPLLKKKVFHFDFHLKNKIHIL